MTYYDYEDYSDYEEEYGNLGRGGFQKTSKAKKMKKEDKPKKNKHTRSVSPEDIWDMMESNSEENSGSKKNERETYTTLADVSKNNYAERKNNNSQTPQGEKKFVPGPNTQTIRNYQIDFDRVFDITKTEGEYNGRKNFGVRFEFKGTKGLFRVIWFHSQNDRDALYDEKYAFWTSLGTCPLNRKKEGVKNGRY